MFQLIDQLVKQVLRRCVVFDLWPSNIKSIWTTNNQELLIHNKNYLRYFNFVSAIIISSCNYNQVLNEYEILPDKRIIATYLLEVYEIVGVGKDVIDTRFYRFEP